MLRENKRLSATQDCISSDAVYGFSITLNWKNVWNVISQFNLEVFFFFNYEVFFCVFPGASIAVFRYKKIKIYHFVKI